MPYIAVNSPRWCRPDVRSLCSGIVRHICTDALRGATAVRVSAVRATGRGSGRGMIAPSLIARGVLTMT